MAKIIRYFLAALALSACAQANPRPISFNAPRSSLIAWTTSSVAVGDFNRDGIPDVAVTPNQTGLGEVSVYLGKGDGTFFAPVQYPLGLGTSAVAIGDFNGDGKLDLTVADNNFYEGSSNVSILLGNGDGTFQAALTTAVQYSPVAILIADFNRDGKADVAVANSGSNTVSILLGNGDGTLQPQVAYAVGTTPVSLAAGDFNGDGKVDLVTANSGSNTLSILSGKGDGTFQPQVVTPAGVNPRSIVSGDFNDDGQSDLAVANGGGSAEVLLGIGANTFAAPIYLAASQPVSITAAFLHSGHNLDLAVTLANDTTEVFRGVGNGHFILDQTIAPGGNAIAVGDFNSDGSPDILLAPGAQFSVLLGNGKGTFESVSSVPVGRGPYAIAKGDFNHDGKVDLVVANYGLFPYTLNTVSVLLGNGDGTFRPQVQYGAGNQPISVAVGDFNRDGNLDILTANSSINPGTFSILFGNGDGTFQPVVTLPSGTGYVSFATAGDFNNDGNSDVALSDESGNLVVLLGKGNGTFQPPVVYAIGSNVLSILVADLNHDGRPDLALAAGSNLEVLLGSGDGTFGNPKTVASAAPGVFNGLSAGDFDGDGKTDLAVVNFAGSALEIFLGNADGTFRKKSSYYVNGSLSVAAADFNTDGHLDLAVTSRGFTSVFVGVGDGTFTEPANFSTAGAPQALITGDFNRDGMPDLAIVDYEPFNVSILTNTTK